MEPEHPSEQIALRALRDRWLWGDDLLGLTAHLPSSTRNFHYPEQRDTWSCSFLTGAYIHGVSTGVMGNTRRYPQVTTLLTSVLRSAAPSAWFSSAGVSLNLRSHVHRDSNNSAIIPNVLVPASNFVNGELWIEDSAGLRSMEGRMGRLIPVARPFISFNPRTRHANNSWQGNRLVLVGYHVRNLELFAGNTCAELRSFGFQLYEGR